MNKQKETHAAPTSEQQKRQLWIKPVVQKIKAGEAEVGTRTTPTVRSQRPDGQFNGLASRTHLRISSRGARVCAFASPLQFRCIGWK